MNPMGEVSSTCRYLTANAKGILNICAVGWGWPLRPNLFSKCQRGSLCAVIHYFLITVKSGDLWEAYSAENNQNLCSKGWNILTFNSMCRSSSKNSGSYISHNASQQHHMLAHPCLENAHVLQTFIPWNDGSSAMHYHWETKWCIIFCSC